jgi:hypothetical protein
MKSNGGFRNSIRCLFSLPSLQFSLTSLRDGGLRDERTHEGFSSDDSNSPPSFARLPRYSSLSKRYPKVFVFATIENFVTHPSPCSTISLGLLSNFHIIVDPFHGMRITNSHNHAGIGLLPFRRDLTHDYIMEENELNGCNFDIGADASVFWGKKGTQTGIKDSAEVLTLAWSFTIETGDVTRTLSNVSRASP